MLEDNGLRRREFLASVATLGAAGTSINSLVSRPVFSVELAVTEELADLSEEETGQRKYILELVDEWIDRTVRPLKPDILFDIEYRGFEPSVDEHPEEAVREWEKLSDQKNCSLLVTGDEYGRIVGLAEEKDDLMDSSAALVGEGYDFLRLEEGDWRDKVEIVDYEPLLGPELNFTPWKTVVSVLHEFGHSMGLEHEDGEIYEVEDGVAGSIMLASYIPDYMEEDDIRYSDEILWMTSFSDESINSVCNQLEKNS